MGTGRDASAALTGGDERDLWAKTGAFSMESCMFCRGSDLGAACMSAPERELRLCAFSTLAEQGVWDAPLQTLFDLGLADAC